MGKRNKISYLPDLVITISVPSLWNLSHRSFWSKVTLGSSLTLSSSGRGTRGGTPAKGNPGSLGKIAPLMPPPAGVLKLLVGPRAAPSGGNPGAMEEGTGAGGAGKMPGNPKSGLGAKLGINGVVKAMFALQGDIIVYTTTLIDPLSIVSFKSLSILLLLSIYSITALDVSRVKAVLVMAHTGVYTEVAGCDICA